MTLTDLLRWLGFKLLRTEYAPLLREYVATIDGAEAKDGRFLLTIHGYGKTPDEAAQSLVENLRGQVLVTDAYGPNRKEYQVPSNLVLRFD